MSRLLTPEQYDLLVNHLRPRVLLGELTEDLSGMRRGGRVPTHTERLDSIRTVVFALENGMYPGVHTLRDMFSRDILAEYRYLPLPALMDWLVVSLRQFRRLKVKL